MRTTFLRVTLLAGLVIGNAQPAAADSAPPSFERLSTYDTGLADVAAAASAGETAALKYGRLYVTNALDASVDIVSVLKPREPKLLKRVDLSSYGAKVNSVDVSILDLVAVAVEGVKKTDPGKIVLMTPSGTVLRVVEVGALPDMVTFTPDGRKLLVANEGEPDCYGADCTDPPGSVSIVTVLPWLPARPVKTVTFDGVPLPADVRIFGPGSSPAQDLEPEYISVSSDGDTAYVTLQENNAIAEIDIASAKVTEVHALGYKHFNQPPTVATHEIKNMPSIGTTIGNQELTLGGFSGLFYEGQSASGRLKFVANTDRGPNGAPTGVKRPFLLPDFTPRIVRFELDPTSGEVAITQQIELKNADGTKLTGLPNTALGGTGSKPYDDEVPVDLLGNVITPLDPLGGDFEGIVVDTDGSFWLPDEYRPAIYHFDSAGILLDRYIPIGTHAAAGLVPPAPGAAGVFGVEALPAVLGQRRPNRGFEAIAMQGGKLYAFVQSPLRNPVTLTNGQLDVLKNIRVVEFDPATLATRQFLYVMDQPALVGATDTRADKIGDATALPARGFLVSERDDDSISTGNPITKRIYAFDLTGATAITPSKDTLYDVGGGVMKSLDQMNTTELALATVNVKPVTKVLHVDLGDTAYNTVQKVEGLALIDAGTLAVVNDNDFGVAVIDINPDGTFTLGYTPEPTLLGLIQTHGFDASDRDNVINIRNWPVYGMYQPDGIAAYSVDGRRLLITANEGDARAWPGLTEEARAKDVKASYPAVPEAAVDAQLGRLTITTSPPPGTTLPYVFGTRSFSIWDAASGDQVWDSGTDLEVLTAAQLPANFNSNNDANNFDNRSDNKGPEPEGVANGRIGTHQYAFVGLERIGGVVVYDVTDPTRPEFIQYLVNRDFTKDPVGPDSGPEIVRFVRDIESPNGKPMLVVANELSGTVSLWGLSNAKPWWQRWRRIFVHD
jgi:hypothetical protein